MNSSHREKICCRERYLPAFSGPAIVQRGLVVHSSGGCQFNCVLYTSSQFSKNELQS